MTDREIFDRDGFLKVPAIIMDPKNLYAEIPRDPNGFKLSGSIMHYPKKEPEFKKRKLRCLAHSQYTTIQSIVRYIVS